MRSYGNKLNTTHKNLKKEKENKRKISLIYTRKLLLLFVIGWFQRVRSDKNCIKYLYNHVNFVEKLGLKSSPKVKMNDRFHKI